MQGLLKAEVNDADILRVFERQERNYGAVLENHAILARRPGIFRGFRVMWDELDRGYLLGARLTGLVNVRVAGLIGCGLCLQANSVLSRAHGVSDDELRDLTSASVGERFSEGERVALAYADAMTLSNSVDHELFEQLRLHFSDEAIIELTATIAWEICSAKFNRALEIDWNASCPVAQV